jgi:enoyl-CoA hydratase/carnithine racemase
MTLQFNRPDKKNAITADMYQALADGLNEASKSDSVRVVTIIGNDSSFCAGNDLKDFLENPPHAEDSPVWQFLFALASCTKPMIAGVNGPAVGIGTTLLLHCDLVVASDSAVFALPFTSLGLCPEAGSSLLMPENLGMKKATEWLLLGDRFNNRQAEQAGLINRAVETSDQVAQQLVEWQQKLLKLPAESVLTTRELLRRANRARLMERIREEGEFFKELLDGEAAKSAFEAFLKK